MPLLVCIGLVATLGLVGNLVAAAKKGEKKQKHKPSEWPNQEELSEWYRDVAEDVDTPWGGTANDYDYVECIGRSCDMLIPIHKQTKQGSVCYCPRAACPRSSDGSRAHKNVWCRRCKQLTTKSCTACTDVWMGGQSDVVHNCRGQGCPVLLLVPASHGFGEVVYCPKENCRQHEDSSLQAGGRQVFCRRCEELTKSSNFNTKHPAATCNADNPEPPKGLQLEPADGAGISWYPNKETPWGGCAADYYQTKQCVGCKKFIRVHKDTVQNSLIRCPHDGCERGANPPKLPQHWCRLHKDLFKSPHADNQCVRTWLGGAGRMVVRCTAQQCGVMIVIPADTPHGSIIRCTHPPCKQFREAGDKMLKQKICRRCETLCTGVAWDKLHPVSTCQTDPLNAPDGFKTATGDAQVALPAGYVATGVAIKKPRVPDRPPIDGALLFYWVMLKLVHPEARYLDPLLPDRRPLLASNVLPWEAAEVRAAAIAGWESLSADQQTAWNREARNFDSPLEMTASKALELWDARGMEPLELRERAAGDLPVAGGAGAGADEEEEREEARQARALREITFELLGAVGRGVDDTEYVRLGLGMLELVGVGLGKTA